MTERATISPEYLALQRELHASAEYGVLSLHYAAVVKKTMQQVRARSLSDYGAGKCNLRKALTEQGLTDFEYFPYDPAFPEYGPPKPADLVCCIGVLEHIEPDYLDAVLFDLRNITRAFGFFVIGIEPAKKTLADGRNAHLIQRPISWWLPKLSEHFEVGHLQRSPGVFWVIVEPRQTNS